MNEIAYVRSDHHAADAFPLLRSSLLLLFFVHPSSLSSFYSMRCSFSFSFQLCVLLRLALFFLCPNRQVGKKQRCEYGKTEKCLVGIVATSNARRDTYSCTMQMNNYCVAFRSVYAWNNSNRGHDDAKCSFCACNCNWSCNRNRGRNRSIGATLARDCVSSEIIIFAYLEQESLRVPEWKRTLPTAYCTNGASNVGSNAALPSYWMNNTKCIHRL